MFPCIFPAPEVTSAPRDAQPCAHPRGRKHPKPPKKELGWEEGGTRLHQGSCLLCSDSPLPLHLPFSPKFHPEQNHTQDPGSLRVKSKPGGAAQSHESQSRKLQTPHGAGKPRGSTPNPDRSSMPTTQLRQHQAPRAGDLSPSPSLNPVSAPSIPISLASATHTQKLWVFCLLDARAIFNYKAPSP